MITHALITPVPPLGTSIRQAMEDAADTCAVEISGIGVFSGLIVPIDSLKNVLTASQMKLDRYRDLDKGVIEVRLKKIHSEGNKDNIEYIDSTACSRCGNYDDDSDGGCDCDDGDRCPCCDFSLENGDCECNRCSYCDALWEPHYRDCDCTRCELCEDTIQECSCSRCSDCSELLDECDCEKCSDCSELMSECSCEICATCSKLMDECTCTVNADKCDCDENNKKQE